MNTIINRFEGNLSRCTPEVCLFEEKTILLNFQDNNFLSTYPLAPYVDVILKNRRRLIDARVQESGKNLCKHETC